MNTAGKDRTEGDPQEYDRSPQCTLHGSEDRAQTSDIKKLDQKEFPLGHDYVVDTIVDSDCRCLSVIRTENVIYEVAVVAFRAKCKMFSRHLQKPILKTEKGRFKGL